MAFYSDYSETELLSFLKSGDTIAFNEIYARFWKKLYALAYNRLRDVPLAEDIVHDVFTALWKNREVSEISNLAGYLATAVKYHILAAYRKSQIQADISLTSEHLLVLPGDVADQLHFKRIIAILQLEVEKLPEKCKLVYKMSREEHKSTREIAEELNISTSTVENHLNKALSRLKVVLKNLNMLLFSAIL